MSGHHPAGYVPGLDGLRAASVSIVAFAHFGFSDLIPGGLGVTVFFFLSGYLITRLLLAEQVKHARVDLGRFYGRRFLRLGPELLAFLLFTALLAPPLFGVRATPEQLLAGLFYVTNYVQLLSGPKCENCALTGHLWSLAVEEHFYLIMPLALVLLRADPRRLTWLFLGVIAWGLLWRSGVVFMAGGGEPYTYIATESRIDSIAWGCLAAVLQARGSAVIGVIERRPLAAFGGGLLLLLITLAVRDEAFRESVRYSLQVLALFALVMALILGPRLQPLVRLLEWSPIRWMGRLSYGAYLWHFVALAAVAAAWRAAGIEFEDEAGLALRVAFALTAFAAMWVIAGLSYALVFRPFQRFKPLLQPGARSAAAAPERPADLASRMPAP